MLLVASPCLAVLAFDAAPIRTDILVSINLAILRRIFG
jgi:hypothetical protein